MTCRPPELFSMEGCSVQPNQYETKDGKEKRGFPSKQCPKCGATVHARKFQCPECGHKFEIGQKKATAKAAAKEPMAVINGPLAAVNEAAATIRNLGGLEKVKQLVAQAKEAQEAIDRLGGIEDAEATVEALEMLKGL